MINTIFYFVDTDQEYQAKRDSGEIKPYTIVFVRDTRSIWKNGVRYGGVTSAEMEYAMDGYMEDVNNIINSINTAIDEINQQADEEKDRLDGVIDDLDSSIQNKIEDLFADSHWVEDNQPQWSTIRQDLSTIQTAVNNINKVGGSLDVLQSQITQEVVDRNQAITDLSNTYARVTDVNGVKNIVEWMYSGLKSSTAPDKSYAEIMAAGKNGMDSAISDLRTSVENIDDTYVAKSSLTSAVNDAISGVVNTTTEGQAMSSMFSKIDENSDDIAAIATKVTGDSSQSTVAAKLNGMTASLVTTANLDSSIAALSAQAKDTVGNAIAATIFAKANEQGSNITLNADKIYLAGQTWAQYINALGITARNVNVTDENDNVVAKIDSTGRARFMNGNLYIPWRTQNMDGTGYSYNPTLVFVDTDNSRKTVWGVWGINNQNSAGIVSSAVTLQPDGADLRSYTGSAPYNNLMQFGVNKTHQVTRSDVQGPGYSQLGNYKNVQVDGQDQIVAANEGLFTMEGFSVMDAQVNDVVYFRTSAFVLHSSQFTSDVSLTVSSDERLKTIIDNVQPSVEDISKIRTVDFQYKDDNKNIVRSGSIAQDWQAVLPNVVSENQDGYLTLDYGSAALISAVTAAKEIVALKKENEDLKQRLAAIEAKLNI